ncbi:MAG: acetyl-CoA acetyltransferase [Burkholderiales bacterium]|jgi:acetyl-CoA acyltransferase|nr:acetyl-CoA acetyltransferase [Burkholderiales bacterium]MCE3268368.1 acetyl-CoA acetyltransferase [Burkholderiales bacterium]
MNKAVYIVAAKRAAVGKAKRGGFAKQRPDELLAKVIADVVSQSKIDPKDISDVIIGCAFPEAEQGQNVARIASLLAGLPDSVPGITVNRYCGSGLNSIAMAANVIALGQADVMLAGGIESMSLIPMGGNDWSASPEIFKKDENIAIAYGMGITAENVANEWKISRADQDAFAAQSHKRAIAAINAGYFKDEIVPVEVDHELPDENSGKIINKKVLVDTDEGPRADTNLEALAKLKPAFAAKGSVTAGNSSQMSDGAACLVLVSEDYLKKHNLTPLGKFLGFVVAGVPARIMGIGPVKAVPMALEQAGLTLDQIDWIELNEAFAAQGLAVIRDLKLDEEKVNPCGGAIAMGHPLGATGAILTTKLLYGLRRTGKKYGMVTMCIGTGMGAAGIFERV